MLRILISSFFLFRIAFSVEGWAWISGSQSFDEYGSYGLKNIPSPSNVPGSRYGGLSWIDNQDHLWLFGAKSGFDGTGYNTYGFLYDFWKFDGEYWTWVDGSDQINQLTFSMSIPTLDSIKCAGSSSQIYFSPESELWEFNIQTLEQNWTKIADGKQYYGIYGTKGIPNSNNAPGNRYRGGCWIDSERNIWMFGGNGYSGINSSTAFGLLNDLWMYNGVNWTWIAGSFVLNQRGQYGVQGIPNLNNSPGARYDFAYWINSNDNIWLFGGFGYPSTNANPNAQTSRDDLWKFNGQNWTWISGSDSAQSEGTFGRRGESSASNYPPSWSGMMSKTDSLGNVWLFGGTTQATGLSNLLWKFDGRNWTWITGSNTYSENYNYGTKGVPSIYNSPPLRQNAIFEIDSSDNLWLFGGVAGARRNDLWIFPNISSLNTTAIALSYHYTTGFITTSPVSTGLAALTSSLVSTGLAALTSSTTDSAQLDKDTQPLSRELISVIASVSVISAIIFIIAITIFLWRKMKRRTYHSESSLEMIQKHSSSSFVSLLENVKVKTLIGEGSFGKVFKGNWNETDVALKQLKNEDDKEFQREVDTLCRLNHPNIIRILGLFVNQEGSYIVMEFMEDSLLNLLKKNSYALSKKISMMISIGQGMAYLESQKIVHCDLAARNILVDHQGLVCKVSDFGLSKRVAALYASDYSTNRTEKPVPIRWAAPEILKREKPGLKSDVWSFGVVMWEILTEGQVPYTHYHELPSLARDIIDNKVQLDIPKDCQGVDEIIQQCCSYSTDARPTFVEVVKKLKLINSPTPYILSGADPYSIIPNSDRSSVF